MARFRFKAVAPSSEVVEGELEASDRQAAIGRLRELNHLPVRVEEMRDAPLRRRQPPERIEPVMAEPPRIEAGRPEPQLVSPPPPELGPEPQPPPEPETAPAPPPARKPIVRLREVLRGTVRQGRAKPAIVVVAPPAPPAPEPMPESAPGPPLQPVPSAEAVPGEAPIEPPAAHVAEAMPPAVAPVEPSAAAPPMAEAAGTGEAEWAVPTEVPAEAPPESADERLAALDVHAAPLPEEPASGRGLPGEMPPEPPVGPALDREDEPYPPAYRTVATREEPLPMRWDVTPGEPLPAAEAAPPSAGLPDESSAGRWLAEVERSTVERIEPAVPEEPVEPYLEPSRAVVPAGVTLPAVAMPDLAAAREAPEAEPGRAEAPRAARDKRKAKAKRARRALPARLLPVFTRELQVLLAAGLPMDHALRIIVESTADDRVAAAADALLARVRGGALLSEAMEALPEQFDEFLRTAVRAGEAGGSLAEVLEQVAAYQERGQKLERSVRTAMIYPTVLAFAAAVSVTLLLTLVVPQFEALLRQSAQTPPLATRLVIAASVQLRQYGWIAPAAGLVVWLLARWRARGLRGRARLHARLLRLPLVGKVVAGVSAERLARALGTLLANGVPLPEALPLVANAVPNRAIGAVVAAAAERVKQGERLADALEEGRVLPSLAVQLIRVGEEGGRLSEMLARVADIYAGDVDVAVRRVAAVIEPALILTIGIVVGGIVLSLLAAITGLNTLAL
ncbi:MAG: type II secretion system F family protein [Alphaproteobacteria bacterium]|nr:type II secretion system F family protein [Alphaproteobacteria bacterium]